ncbi:MAG: hypothetical protein E3K37_05895 [Candidatus Kuenenia sp.]|nr:hypothetical protein [Candidatus Kuenenia hertensis]
MNTVFTLACQVKCIQCILIKKETIIPVRLPSEIKDIIQSLTDSDERTVGWMVHKLLTEALEARNLLKTKPKDK